MDLDELLARANKPKALIAASGDWDIFDVLQSHILPGTEHGPNWRIEAHAVVDGHFLSLSDQHWSLLGAREAQSVVALQEVPKRVNVRQFAPINAKK